MILPFNGKKFFTTNATRTPHQTPVAWDIPLATCGLKTWSWKPDFSLFFWTKTFFLLECFTTLTKYKELFVLQKKQHTFQLTIRNYKIMDYKRL